MNKISLYFHIPFCTRKCDYCHFYVLPDKDLFKSQLLEGLELEWKRWLPEIQNKEIVSVYFGGGTPALFGAKAIQTILTWIKTTLPLSAEVEITLEANPENISYDLMKAYAEAGVNRVSIGLQALDDPLLKRLGRLHSANKALDSVQLTYEGGIHNISVDLMYDLPGQTLHHWKETLRQVVDLPITHLSLYNLTLEPQTVFFKQKELIRKELPPEETSTAMYEQALVTLEANGLQQYEISAFARNKAYSRHNVGYWTGRPFLGLGPSAFSYWKERRFRNMANLSKYLQLLKKDQSPIDFDEELDPLAKQRELLTIQLRLVEGVNLKAFQIDSETKNSLIRLENQGFLENRHDRIRLTRKGIFFYDTVAVELI